jgi:hypothetical protein
MVSVEDLMGLGLTRRKVHEIAIELGLGKAEEYPDDSVPAFQAKIANGSKGNGSNGKSGFSSAHTAAAEEYAADAQEDLQYVQEAAENRAAGMIVALDTLTMYHCATRQFTNKSLQKQVNESRSRVKQVLTGVAAFYEPTSFLSQTPLGQLMNGIGDNGLTSSMRSLSGNGSELEPNDLEVSS